MPCRVSKAEFGRHVDAALAELPPAFAEVLSRVPVQVRDRPTGRELRSVGLGPQDLLLGLYVGNSLADRSVMDGVEMPPVIYLFHEDLEDACETPAELQHEIRTTVLHEIGHHLGLDEDDLDRLGYG